jgi:hypothetical protein
MSSASSTTGELYSGLCELSLMKGGRIDEAKLQQVKKEN